MTKITRSGFIPDKSARSSLSENALIDFPVLVLFKNQKIASTGDVNWVIDFLGESTPLDPVSSGFQIRENVKNGLTNFDINLIKLDEGLIYKSSYSVVGEEVLEIKDTKYPCIVLERIANERKTLYYVAKTLDFILIKVEDDRKERMLSIEAEKILSFG